MRGDVPAQGEDREGVVRDEEGQEGGTLLCQILNPMSGHMAQHEAFKYNAQI